MIAGCDHGEAGAHLYLWDANFSLVNRVRVPFCGPAPCVTMVAFQDGSFLLRVAVSFSLAILETTG